VVSCAASVLLAGLLDDGCRLVEVVRTRTSVHYTTGRDDVPVLCLGAPAAPRLPASVLAAVLPSSRLSVGEGALTDGTTTWQVTRWWQPPRPHGLVPPFDPPRPAQVLPDISPHELVGLGPGLTPTGDDIVAGALVAAHATSDPRLARWRAETGDALRTRRTTAVSHGLLRHAMDGYATPELAAFVTAVCAGEPERATAALLAVGHTSGAALAAGALHVLTTHPTARGRAA
jgi:hypothetical protein